MDRTTEPILSAGVSAEEYRTLFGAHAGSVTILTAAAAGEFAGFTATSVISVSAAPPRVVFSISETSSCADVFEQSAHVGVHFLSPADIDLALTFARPGIDRFAETRWHSDPSGVPLLPVRTIALGKIVQRITAGSSMLYEVELLSLRAESDREPLIYLGRTFVRPAPN